MEKFNQYSRSPYLLPIKAGELWLVQVQGQRQGRVVQDPAEAGADALLRPPVAAQVEPLIHPHHLHQQSM